jgi:hypothetical protein
MTMTIEQEVLNATCDDWESLDQILLAVRFEFASEHYNPEQADIHYWRDRNPTVTLDEIVKTIKSLVQQGQMDARLADRTSTATISSEEVISSWFRITDAGRSVLKEVVLE